MATTKKKRGTKGVNRENRVALAESKIFDVSEAFDFLRILIYSKPKVGKTTLGATAPSAFVLDCNEKGTLSIRRAKGVKVFKAEKWDDIELAFWYLHSTKHDFETVVLDTITSMATMAMRKVLGREEQEDEVTELVMPSKREWGYVGDMVGTKILEFRSLPMNLIILAQERTGFTDDDDETTEVFPEVSPSIRKVLTPAVDIIGRLFVKEVVTKGKGGKRRRVYERRLLIGEDERYTSGDRSNAGLGRVIRNPNISDILDLIRAQEEE